MKEFDAIVIGAGITGLVTAYQLSKQGLSIALLEASSEVGGVMRSERVDDYLLEWGPNSFLESPEANRLIEELGLENEFVTANPRAPRYIYFRNRLNAVPMSPLAFLTSPLLSATGKLRIFAEPFQPSPQKDKNTQKLEPHNVIEESIASFVRRRIGREAHDRLIAPFISGVYAGNTERLSIQASLPALANLEAQYGSLILGAIRGALSAARAKKKTPGSNNQPKAGKRLCSFLSGMQTLPRTLAKILSTQLMLNCQISPISQISQITPINQLNVNYHNSAIHPPRYQMQVKVGNESQQFCTNKLVLATPAEATAGLLSQLLPNLGVELAAIEYAPIAIAYASFDNFELAKPLNGFGFLIPRTEGKRLLGSIWSSSLFPDRAPQGRALLTNFIGGAHDPAIIDLPDDEIAALAAAELQVMLGSAKPPQIIKIRKIPRAIPQFNLGHLARIKRIETLLADYPGIWLAGNFLRGVSVPDCLSRGIKLAEEIGEQSFNTKDTKV